MQYNNKNLRCDSVNSGKRQHRHHHHCRHHHCSHHHHYHNHIIIIINSIQLFVTVQADRLHGTTSLIKHFLHALFASMQKTPHFLKKYHHSYLFFYLLFTLSDSIGISSDIFLARLSFCILDFRARLLSLCYAMSTRA